jgi:hypothetical protein
VSYYERIVQADFGFYSIDARGFKIVANHPHGHGMVVTDFSYNIDTHELTFANNLAGTVTETVENQKISDTLKNLWSDSKVELNWQVQPEWPSAGRGAFIKDMLEMTWEEFVSL